MKNTYHKTRMWFWSLFHCWTLAKMNRVQADRLAQVIALDSVARTGLICALRGTNKGWTATIAKHGAHFMANSLPELLETIAKAE